tara:strand:+ start:2005 stop:3411 length:1407 start_codon:yes stop_codon:yes gene_type:complete
MRNKYYNLFNLSNNILNDSNSVKAIHAISFLNNIKIDSYQLNKIELLRKKNFLYFYFLLILNFLKLIIKLLISIILTNEKKNTKKKILFINTFLNKKNTDIYFRNFFKIKEIKKKSLNLFIDPSALNNFLNYENVIPFKNLNFLDEIKIIKEIVNGYIFIKKKYFKEKNHFKKKFLLASSSYLFSGDTYLTLRICYSLKKFVIANKIKKVVTLYEGHGYERLIFYFLKELDFCESIAYQHTGISKFQNNLLKLRNFKYYPDKILVVNEYDKLKFKEFNKYSKIYNIGKKLKNTNTKKWKLFNKKILVFLTTSSYENKKVIDLICDKNFENNKNYKFIIRFHPNTNNKIKKLIKKKIELTDLNYSISLKKTLDNNLNICSTAIIGSGSSLIDCIDKGVFPLIFKTSKLIDTPANQNEKIFKFIKNSKELDQFIKKYNKNILRYKFKKHLIFSNNYFNNLKFSLLRKSFK